MSHAVSARAPIEHSFCAARIFFVRTRAAPSNTGEWLLLDNPGASTYLAFFVLLAFSAFFSASETALSSVNRVRLKTKAEDGDRKASAVLRLAEDFDRTLSAILIGNNVVNIASTAIATTVATALLGASGPAVATAVTTVLVLTFGEILPKSFAKENAEAVSRATAAPLGIIKIILTPFVVIFVFIKRLFTGHRSNELNVQPSVTEEELKTIIDTVEEEGVLDSRETNIIQSAIEFDNITVQDILVPRVDMAALPIDATGEETIARCVSGGYSRIPVYDGTVDNIVGVVYAKDMLAAVARKEEASPRRLLRTVKFVYRTKGISDLLSELKRDKQHMAIVTDEHGGTVGLVTMEDILEELVGEIWDESDRAKMSVCRIDDNTWQVSADTKPEELFEAIGFEDKDFDTDYTTVGGWVLELLEHIPVEGETLHYKDLDMRILSVEEQRIRQIEVKKVAREEQPEKK